ncbi:SPX domain-containing protein [Russula emetica]|nr:SPX domain-containing protein [Russula emetica]
MKFARYLESAQAPEWKRAYIDYRGLKKRITAIRRARGDAGNQVYVSSESDSDHLPRDTRASAHCSDGQKITDEGHEADDETNAHDGRHEHQTDVNAPTDSIELNELKRSMDDHSKVTTSASPETTSTPQFLLALGQGVAPPQPLETKQSALPPLKPRPGQGLRRRTPARFISSHTVTSFSTANPPTLAEVLESMSPIQLEFFNKFNAELSKVESFFIEREAEARERTMQLRGQLEELKDHRRLFQEAHPDVQAALRFLPSSGSKISTLMSYVRCFLHRSTHTDNKPRNADVPRVFPARHRAGGATLDPDDYLHARKQLKRAVSEHYHALEVLNNYRILNITGFRKALKKFEKVTGVLVQDLYMKEKVDSCAFASDETVQQFLKEMEDSFTARFSRGIVVIKLQLASDNIIRSERRQKARIGSPTGGFFSQDTPF